MRVEPLNDTEQWEDLREFPRYMISSEGRVYNKNTGRYMRVSPNNYGHPKISLLTEHGTRETRSVAMLVAVAFVQKPNIRCDRLIYLNGDLSDYRASNLAWRPRGFGWQYSRQIRAEQPAYFRNLPVINTTTNVRYNNIVEAGMSEGLLFEHIWHSTYTGNPIFPNGSVWVVDK